jgi:large subunit ribosomal protein L6
MSRIGKQPIILPKEVTAKIEGDKIYVKGPLGELSQKIPPQICVNLENNIIKVTRTSEEKQAKALHGLTRVLINNMVIGVTQGFKKSLELVGAKYKVDLKDGKLVFKLGYSHNVEFLPPEGIKVSVDKNIITVSGIDKYLVGETAARIRRLKPPEPYHGTGIKYVDEQIRRKVGKAMAAIGSGVGGKK